MSLPPKTNFRIDDLHTVALIYQKSILMAIIFHLLLLEMDGAPETFGVCYVEETPLVCFHEQGILTSLL